MQNIKVGDKVVILRSFYEGFEKFSAGAVLTVAKLSVNGRGALLCPTNHNPELSHNFEHGMLYFDFLEFRPMYKMSEMLQMAIDTKQYTVGAYMCHALYRMALSDKITKQEAEFAEARINKQMDAIVKNLYRQGKVRSPRRMTIALGSLMLQKYRNSDGSVKNDYAKRCMQYYKKWIRDLRRRGN